MPTIPQYEPARLIKGETLLFQRVLGEYPAGTWTLNYTLLGPTSVNITATANGATHEINVTAATTNNYHSGNYVVHARVTDGTSVFPVAVLHQTIEIANNPLTSFTPLADVRSWARQTLDSVETALAALASKTVSSASVNGTTYTLQDLAALQALRGNLKAEVANEDVSANPSRRLVYARFTSPT